MFVNAVEWLGQRLKVGPLAVATVLASCGLGLLFTPWRFNSALLMSGIVTMAAIVYLLALLQTGRFNARTLSWAVAFHVAFAVGLIPILT